MINIQDIFNEQKEINNLNKIYNKKINDMQWQYINEKYDLQKDCVCRIKNSYAILSSIKFFSEDIIWMNLFPIKKDGQIGKKNTWLDISTITKEFETYSEYEKSLNNL